MPSSLASAFNRVLHDLAETVMPCKRAKSCHLSTLNSGEGKFLSANDTFDFAPYIVIRFVFQVGDAEELSRAFVLERRDPFPYLKEAIQCFTSVDDGWIRPVTCST